MVAAKTVSGWKRPKWSQRWQWPNILWERMCTKQPTRFSHLVRKRRFLHGFGDINSTLLQTGLQIFLHLDESVAEIDEVVLQLRDALRILQPPNVTVHRPLVQLGFHLGSEGLRQKINNVACLPILSVMCVYVGH